MITSGLLAPLLGGIISLFIWGFKRGVEREARFINKVGAIEDSVIELTIIAKNNSEMLIHQHRDIEAVNHKVDTLDKRLWDLNDRIR
jgi:hypothetical protein